jgi:hypothetical protein
MTKKLMPTRALASGAAVLALLTATIGGAAPAAAAVAETRTFVGYGYLPSDAHADAVNQMNAYSSTCQEVSTQYSPAGSEHYWKATLTAEC